MYTTLTEAGRMSAYIIQPGSISRRTARRTPRVNQTPALGPAWHVDSLLGLALGRHSLSPPSPFTSTWGRHVCEEYQGISSLPPHLPPPPGCVENVTALCIRGDIFGKVWAARSCICVLENNSTQADFLHETNSSTCSVIKGTTGVFHFLFLWRKVAGGHSYDDNRGDSVLTSVNRGSRWKGRRGLASGEAWVLPSMGRASGGRTPWHTLPRRQARQGWDR